MKPKTVVIDDKDWPREIASAVSFTAVTDIVVSSQERKKLAERALARKGRDNVSVTVAKRSVHGVE